MEPITQAFNMIRSQPVKSQADWLAQLCDHIGGYNSPTDWWRFYIMLKDVCYMDEQQTKCDGAVRFIDEARSRIKSRILYNDDPSEVAAALEFCNRKQRSVYNYFG